MHTICIVCRRGYSRAHHQRDRVSFNARRRRRMAGYRTRNRAFIEEYFLAHPCIDCGLVDPIVMEFDHVLPGKISDVSTMVRDGSPIAKIQREIAKCVVRCANCHRRKTAREFWGRTGVYPHAADISLPAGAAISMLVDSGGCSSVG